MKNELQDSGSYICTDFQSWTYIEHINLKITGEVRVKYRIRGIFCRGIKALGKNEVIYIEKVERQIKTWTEH